MYRRIGASCGRSLAKNPFFGAYLLHVLNSSEPDIDVSHLYVRRTSGNFDYNPH